MTAKDDFLRREELQDMMRTALTIEEMKEVIAHAETMREAYMLAEIADNEEIRIHADNIAGSLKW